MRVALAGCLCAAGTAWAQTQGERLLDDFSNPDPWSVVATDDVKATKRVAQGAEGRPALCLDFDFGRVSGFVALRRKLPVDFPARFDLSFGVRGAAQPNALQVKFGDASGDNVWWMQRRGFQPPAQWQRLRIKQKQVEFAWGPASDRVLRRTETLEFVIASGTGIGNGGKGSVCFDRFVLRDLPPPPEVAPVPVVRASSAQAGSQASEALVVAGVPPAWSASAEWRPAAGDRRPVLSIDFGAAREFSAIVLHVRDEAAPARYTIEASDDGTRWRTLQRVTRARGATQPHWLGESEARHLRFAFDRGTAPIALRGIEVRDALSVDALYTTLAQRAPRGVYPRAYRGEQPYWTVLGVEGARVATLFSEDGVLEPVPGVGALEPMLIVDGRVLTWSDARIEHSLVDGELPMPQVRWWMGGASGASGTSEGESKDIALDITAFGEGTPDAPQALASYRVRNMGTHEKDVQLVLAWRPFQANPPTQFLTHPGGASAISRLAWDGKSLRVTPGGAGRAASGQSRLTPIVAPDAVRIEPMAAGPVSAWAAAAASVASAAPATSAASARGDVPRNAPRAKPPRHGADRIDIADPSSQPSAALTWRLSLRPGEERVVGVALPVQGVPAAPSSLADLAEREGAVARRWRQRLGGVRIEGNAQVQEIARTLRASLGHILVNRSGPAIQPGARSYARSWIRDGAMTSSALLRMGRDDVARDFLRWYAPFQFRNGKVPCCATERGADPVPENDSHGEFAYAAADLWHYTHDAALARKMWPHVRAAVDYMEALRHSERTPANRVGERAGYYGLMPPSISHEGYSDKAAYSYWDDHWALIGYRSAIELAQALGLAEEAKRIAAQRDEFQRDLLASIDVTAARYKLDVLSGAADRGDVDPTSSTIALAPGGLLGTLPDALVRNTFDRYWRNFEQRRADDAARVRHGDGAYTPYEWRVVGSFVRLGQRERALEALRYFFADRRPAGWRQWGEVVVRDVREPRFLGDMPHGWVASDHIRSVLDLFAYEHEGQRSLVLAAGVPLEWLQGEGVSIDGLRTPYGVLGWRGRALRGVDRVGDRAAEGATNVIDIEVQTLREMPPGGVLLRGPWPADATATVDGRQAQVSPEGVRLAQTPARVRVQWAEGAPSKEPAR